MATYVVGAIVFGCLALAARSVYKTKKKGGCAGGCSGCEGCGKNSSCH